jgi:hypothetical protein
LTARPSVTPDALSVSEVPTLREKWPSILATVIIAPASAWLLSFAGVAGTVAGIAVGSALSGTAGSVIERWIRLSHQAAARKLAEHKAAADHGRRPPLHADEDPWESYYRPAAAVRRFDIPWRRAALWAAAAIVLSGGSVAVAQAVSHRSASDLVSGTTTVPHRPAPTQTAAPVPSYSPAPAPTGLPSPTPTPAPTVTVSPTSSPSPTPTPAPSPSPSPTMTLP